VPRKGCAAAPAICAGAKVLGPLRAPFAAQGRSYTGYCDMIHRPDLWSATRLGRDFHV